MTLSVRQEVIAQSVDPSVLSKDLEPSFSLTMRWQQFIMEDLEIFACVVREEKDTSLPRNAVHEFRCSDLTIGACLWGLCNDPTQPGCNPATKIAG